MLSKFEKFLNSFNSSSDNGVACGPGCTLILHKALATWPVSATIPNAACAHVV
jgi:hypothetical protein